MVAHPTTGTPSFSQVAKGLIELHELIAEGADDSPEGEAVRDALDTPLHALTSIEKERARWLSEDLYSVSEPPPPETIQAMPPEARRDLEAAVAACHAAAWDEALTLLRRWRDHIAPAALSYLRGTIWAAAGEADVAVVFFRHAAECDPATAAIRRLAGRDMSATAPAA